MAHSIKKKLFYATSLLLLATSCKTNNSKSQEAQDNGQSKNLPLAPNDLSILFPLSDLQGLYGRLPKGSDIPQPDVVAPGQKAAAQDHEPFLPADALMQLSRQMRTASLDDGKLRDPSDFDDDNLQDTFNHFGKDDARSDAARLIGMRIDPCVNIRVIKTDSDCRRQLRLIWQTFREFNNGVSRVGFALPDAKGTAYYLKEDDDTLHMIYDLTREEFTDILATIRANKDPAFDNKPLGANPLMISQGLDNPTFLNAVLGIVHRYARRSKNVAVSGMAGAFVELEWFMTTTAMKDGKPTTTALPGIGDDTSLDQEFGRNVVTSFDGGEPTSASPDNYMPFRAVNVSAAEKTRTMSDKLTKVYRVLNPMIHDVTDTDCGSCHLAVESLAASHQYTVTDPSAQYTSKNWDLSSTDVEAASNDSNNFHMFSFFFDVRTVSHQLVILPHAMVQPRVINETALATDYVNSHYP